MGFHDDLPANCIASWQCPGTTGCGYPRFAVRPGPEVGSRNLAVFTAGCNFSCPFCQDWIHDAMLTMGAPRFTDDEVCAWVDDRTTCVSFCGGTPDLHLDAVTRIARRMVREHRGRILRICAETNLTAPWSRLLPFARLVRKSGGGLNIGLKAGSDTLHRALTGVSNARVWRNIERLHSTLGVGGEVPFLRPSLLVIPGYVDAAEVRLVASRLASLDPRFSLKLIAFLPRYRMTDLPAADDALLASLADVARACGLARVSPARADLIGERFVRRE
jgi:pyruvate formate lyase activating enzyme